MEQAFRFEIGDVVVLRTDRLTDERLARLPAEARSYRVDVPFASPNLIVGRVTEECVGGRQLHYRLRRYGQRSDGATAEAIVTVAEFEVEAFVPTIAVGVPA